MTLTASLDMDSSGSPHADASQSSVSVEHLMLCVCKWCPLHPSLGKMTPTICKEYWKMQSSCVPRRKRALVWRAATHRPWFPVSPPLFTLSCPEGLFWACRAPGIFLGPEDADLSDLRSNGPNPAKSKKTLMDNSKINCNCYTGSKERRQGSGKVDGEAEKIIEQK